MTTWLAFLVGLVLGCFLTLAAFGVRLWARDSVNLPRAQARKWNRIRRDLERRLMNANRIVR